MILSTLLTAKAAAAVLGAGVLVVGGGAAAYAGVLPTALQTVAHDAIGAPAAQGDQGDDATESPEPKATASSTETPDPTESPDAADPAKTPDPTTSPSAHGPDATGPAAFGLCTAHSHGGLPEHSTAGQALLTAAGTGGVDAYCATVLGTATPSAAPSTSTSTQTTPAPATHGKGHAKKHGRSSQHGRPASVPSH